MQLLIKINIIVFSAVKIFFLVIATLLCTECGVALLPLTIPLSLAISSHNESVKQENIAMLKNPNMLDEALTKEENKIIDKINNASDSKKIENGIFELTPYVRFRVNRHQFSRALELNGVLINNIKTNLKGNVGKLANCKLWEARIYYISNKYDKSINSCNQVIELMAQINAHDIDYFMNLTTKDESYSLLGYNYLAKGNLKEAGGYFDKLNTYADVITTLKKTIKTTNYNSDSDDEPTNTIKTISSTYKGKQLIKNGSNEMIDLNGGLIDYYLATGKPESALELLEQQRTWKPPLNMKGFMEGQLRPNAISFFDFQIYWNFRRALVMEALGHDQEAAKSAIEAIFLVDNVRFSFPFDTSTAVLQGYRLGLFNDYYKSAIRIMMNQYGKNSNKDEILNDNNILVATFLCAETIKAQRLIGSVIERVREYSPPQISKELAFDEKNILNQYWNVENPQGSHSWSSQDTSYFNNRIAIYKNYFNNLRNFIDALYSKAPNYAMIYYSRPLRPNEIPLNADELLIEFVMGNDCIYSIISEKRGEKAYGHINIISTKPKEIERDVNKLLALVRTPWNSNDEYSLLANTLCHKLLGDVVNNATHKKLIIVPDGIIGLIPFEALVIKKGTGFKDNTYLSDKFLITYCQSGSFLALLRKSSANISPSKTLLALGNPNIKGRKPLQGSESSVKEIADILEDKAAPPVVLLGNSATKNEINKIGNRSGRLSK